MANRTCSVDNCGREVVARGLCPRCYERLRSQGKITKLPPKAPVECSVLDCSKLVRSNGYCNRHSENLRQYGHVTPVRDWPLVARLIQVGWDETERGCWEWRGKKNDSGYGLINAPRLALESPRVHRLMWAMHNGPIPEGAVVRHRCDNPPCVNPNHLEIGSHLDNMEDMKTRGRSRSYATGRYDGVCANGLHDVSSPGSLKYVTTKSKSYFTCVECDRARKEKWEEARRGKPSAA